MDLEGIIPPMVTPVTGRDGDVDTDRLAALTESLVEGGVHGLFPCGSIGEFPSLTREQRRTVVETVVDAAADDVPVLAGCGATSLGDVRALVSDAADAGADAAVVVTPYYLGTSQAGLREFYRVLADDAELPVVLYNIPQVTGQHLDIETVADLADHDNVVGIKDSSGELTYASRAVEATPPEFSVLLGIAELSVAALDVGADGLVSGPANVFPGPVAEMYEAYRDGDRGRAVDLLNDVTIPVINVTREPPTAAALKYLLAVAGRDAGPPLLPLGELEAHQRTAIEDCYERLSS
ncbi:MAG: dihydrodipicolinate synthase family protein [Halobacteriaceae archaeon]